ncbi:MAG TPA: hypothetical protein VF720_16185 [Candidatus Eisenbacteria bacterium]
MKKIVLFALLISASAATPSSALQTLANFRGYDWTWPVNNCLDCPNTYYEAQGFLTSVNPAFITADFTNKEYTVVLGDDLFLADADTFATVIVAHYVNGSIYFYADDKVLGTPASYNVNGDCDPFQDRLRFADGEQILAGNFYNFDVVSTIATGDGSVQGFVNWLGGTQLGNIPLSLRGGWTFGAIGIRAGNTPCGYHWDINGVSTLQQPLPVQPASWGQIKATGGDPGRLVIKR